MNDINNPLEVIKVEAALKSERMKLEYRKLNKPEDITELDYTIISALEKQIPKKAKLKRFQNSNHYDYHCPVCDSCVINADWNIYCEYCGQKLDWS